MPASFGPGDFEPPMVPLPPAPWQVGQLFFTNSFSPHRAGVSSLPSGPRLQTLGSGSLHLPRVFSNSLYSAGVTTFTVASMPEWLVPQYSAQKTCAGPTTVGVNWMNEYWPGTASRLRRNSGMKKEWRTSSDEMIILYGRPCSSVSSPGTRSPDGYSNSQLHFLARTRISVAPSAAVAFLM